jgi:RhtB (resistance to homoserine/threonine) family protein
MFGIENYITFLIAGIILNITPGSDTMYILTRSIAQGKKAGYYSVYGISTGCFFHTLLASMGLSIILSKSPLAFTIIKYAGVAYLVYIGTKLFFDKKTIFENASKSIEQFDLWKIYRQGVLTNVLNPKVALFFLSFLPQFINPDQTNGPLPFLILGFTFQTTGTLWCLFLAYSASIITNTLRNNNTIAKAMQMLSGLIFIGLGLKILIFKN